MTEPVEIPKSVLIRDLIIFQIKVWLDGFKDVLLVPVSLGAGILDILFGRRADGYRLYAVLRYGERFDLWLNLFGAVQQADREKDGLFGASRAGDDTLLGQLERLAGTETEEEPTAERKP